jgi:GT2 family glycosyltransferase
VPAGRKRYPWLLRVYWLWRDRGTLYVLRRAWLRARGPRQYDPHWIAAHDTLKPTDVAAIARRIERLAQRPRFSLILPVGGAPIELLQAAVASVTAQLYDRWELFVVGDLSAAEKARQVAEADPRIKAICRPGDGEPAAANAALSEASGDVLVRLAADGRLAPHALYLFAEEINRHSDAGLIYGDEDEIDGQGRRRNPHFKTEWNPDLLLSQNYLGRAVAYRTELVRQAGGFRPGFAEAEDYDLALRVVERIPASAIRHCPFVLYHGSGAAMSDAALPQTRRALAEHLARQSIDATVELGPSGCTFRVRRKLPAVPPKVSLIMPTRDRVDLIRGAVESILERTDYPDYEIVVVDNQSTDPEALAYLAQLEHEARARVLRYDRPFNFSAINNFAARRCASPVLGLLNNDILVINRDWLSELVAHAVRPEVGAVGAMLYYPDDTIQHAGIIAGYGSAAINCYGGLPRGSAGYFFRAESIQNYSAVTGACLFTRAEVFAALGGLNEVELAVAFNDVDYCLRLRQRGYLVTWTPCAELYHLESVSRGDDMARDKIRRFRAEEAFLAERWAAALPNDPYYSPNLSRWEGLFELAEDVRARKPWRDA